METNKGFFFSEMDDEKCYKISEHLKYMVEHCIQKMEVYKAVKVKNEDYIFCKEYDTISERGECGRYCSGYIPKNGKSGACKNLGGLYEPGKKYELEIKQHLNNKAITVKIKNR